VHILSEIHTRLRQLEYDAPSYFAQSATIGAQKIVIYSAALVALFAYANTWMWLAGGALLVLLLCLIQTISSFQTRLLHLEQYGKTVVQNDLNSVSAHINQANQLSTPNHSVSESQVQHPATWMQAESSSSNEYSLTQPSQKQLSTSSQTAWWQPILQWMIHGNPILRKKCLPVKKITDEIRQIVQNMIDTMDSLNGVGLAANQIGMAKQVFVMGSNNIDGFPLPFAVFNPRIIEASNELVLDREGCLSYPNLFLTVKRPSWVVDEYQDSDGNL
jgi:peptide deformylase